MGERNLLALARIGGYCCPVFLLIYIIDEVLGT